MCSILLSPHGTHILKGRLLPENIFFWFFVGVLKSGFWHFNTLSAIVELSTLFLVGMLLLFGLFKGEGKGNLAIVWGAALSLKSNVLAVGVTKIKAGNAAMQRKAKWHGSAAMRTHELWVWLGS